MFYTYILKSQTNGKYYIGSTNNIFARVERHNRGQNKSTRYGAPWKLVYYEEFSTKQDAHRREMQIKRYKGGVAFKKLFHWRSGRVVEGAALEKP